MHKTRILIVDDDIGVVKSLRANLASKGFETMTALDGAEALNIIERELPDLIILDIMMPKMNGSDVCQRIREWSQIPIIMLSARRDIEEKAGCLDAGADDYITKPFGVNELVARVRAVLRRSDGMEHAAVTPNFSAGSLKINFVAREVTVGGREIKMTPTEYNLLQELALGSGRVFSHATLLGRVWGPEYAEEREYLRVFIGRLRKLIEEDPLNPKHILTITGVGYKFVGSQN